MVVRDDRKMKSTRLRQKVRLLLATLALVTASGGCRAFAPVDIVVLQRPARERALTDIESLAVVGFKETGVKGIDRFLAAGCERRLQPFFSLVARTRVREVLEERDLWVAVFHDKPAQRKAGEILKASHLFIGTVVKYGCTDTETPTTVRTVVHDGYDWFLAVPIPREVVRMKSAVRVERRAEVKLAMSVVAVDTTESLVSATATAVQSAAPSLDGKPPLPEKEVMLEAATEAALAELLAQLVPVRVRCTMMVATKGELEEGVNSLRAGELDRALLSFQEQTAGSLEGYAWYNVGVVYELQGKFSEAENAYRRAFENRPSEMMFQKALQRVRGRNR